MQVFIIFIIKTINNFYTLIFNDKQLEIRNSPLKEYALIYAKLYICAKIGCGVVGAGAAFIAGGAAYDSILVEAGGEKIFVPMMAKIYKSLAGTDALPNTIEKAINSSISPTPQPVPDVKATIALFHSLTEDQKVEFLGEIQEEINKKNQK